jgi:hypothetical protein
MHEAATAWRDYANIDAMHEAATAWWDYAINSAIEYEPRVECVLRERAERVCAVM